MSGQFDSNDEMLEALKNRTWVARMLDHVLPGPVEASCGARDIDTDDAWVYFVGAAFVARVTQVSAKTTVEVRPLASVLGVTVRVLDDYARMLPEKLNARPDNGIAATLLDITFEGEEVPWSIGGLNWAKYACNRSDDAGPVAEAMWTFVDALKPTCRLTVTELPRQDS